MVYLFWWYKLEWFLNWNIVDILNNYYILKPGSFYLQTSQMCKATMKTCLARKLDNFAILLKLTSDKLCQAAERWSTLAQCCLSSFAQWFWVHQLSNWFLYFVHSSIRDTLFFLCSAYKGHPSIHTPAQTQIQLQIHDSEFPSAAPMILLLDLYLWCDPIVATKALDSCSAGCARRSLGFSSVDGARTTHRNHCTLFSSPFAISFNWTSDNHPKLPEHKNTTLWWGCELCLLKPRSPAATALVLEPMVQYRKQVKLGHAACKDHLLQLPKSVASVAQKS